MTAHRHPRGARLVITLDVEITDDGLRAQPGWRRSCLDALRDNIGTDTSPTKLIAWLRRSKSFTVLDEKIEVCP